MPRTMMVAVALIAGAAVHSPAAAQCTAERNASAGAWDTTNATPHHSTRPAADRIALVRGIACRPDLGMDDAIIDFELAPPSGGFAGIAFRMASAADYEIVYFRAGNDGHWASVQYQPVYEGETTWQLYPGDGYEADLPAHVSVTRDGWMRVRLVIAGRRGDLFIGDDTVPALRVGELKRPRQRGAIGIWAAGSGTSTANAAGSIRNLRVRPLGDVTLADLPPEVAAPGQLMNWRVSKRFAAPDSITFADTLSTEARRAARDGRSVTAESSGLVNLTALIGNAAGPQRTNVFGDAAWGVAYAAITLHADRAKTRRLSLSFSDAVCVYVDGQSVYVGDNRYGRDKAELGVVGRESETVVLHLHPGDNEIVLAVADKAFGWGFRARVDSM